jgi:predicted phosphodiesterase
MSLFNIKIYINEWGNSLQQEHLSLICLGHTHAPIFQKIETSLRRCKAISGSVFAVRRGELRVETVQQDRAATSTLCQLATSARHFALNGRL